MFSCQAFSFQVISRRSFYFFGVFKQLPTGSVAVVYPPQGGTQQAPKTPPQRRRTQCTYAYEQHKPGTRSPRAAIHDYILRLPGSGTRMKKPRHITGAVKSFIHFQQFR